MSEAAQSSGLFFSGGLFSALGQRWMGARRAIDEKLKNSRVLEGGWFRRLIDEHIRHHAGTRDAAHWEAVYPGMDMEARAAAEIARVARKSAVVGAVASVGASAGEIASLTTEGMGAPLGIPAIAVSLLAETIYTAIVQIDLACDIGSIYGEPFDVNDGADLATLFGLALDLPSKKRDQEVGLSKPPGLIDRLLELEDGELARRIGRKLVEDALLSNLIPLAGIPISARSNYVSSRDLGATVRRYARYRRALRLAFAQLKFDTMAEPELLVEGAWILATIDGEAGSEAAMAIALIVDALPEEHRKQITNDRAFGGDEEGWFDALALVPPQMHGALLDVFYLVAATGRTVTPSERRFLQRVGRALDVPVDIKRVEQICRHLALGEALPPGLAPCVRA